MAGASSNRSSHTIPYGGGFGGNPQWAQRLSPRGRLRPIDLGLLGIAKLDAACLGGSQRLACALADHVSLVLGSGSEHVKRQPAGSRHIDNGEIEALAVQVKATLRLKRSSFATSRVAVRCLASAIQRPKKNGR